MKQTNQDDSLSMPLIPAGLSDDTLELEFVGFEDHPAHHVPTYQFHMVHRQTREVVGNIRLSIGSTDHLVRYAGHIGYGVPAEHRGHGYAARAVRLLVPFAHRLEIDPLWITCDPENISSRRTLELAGAEFVEIINVPADCIIHRTGHPRKCRYRLATSSTTTSRPVHRS